MTIFIQPFYTFFLYLRTGVIGQIQLSVCLVTLHKQGFSFISWYPLSPGILYLYSFLYTCTVYDRSVLKVFNKLQVKSFLFYCTSSCQIASAHKLAHEPKAQLIMEDKCQDGAKFCFNFGQSPVQNTFLLIPVMSIMFT